MISNSWLSFDLTKQKVIKMEELSSSKQIWYSIFLKFNRHSQIKKWKNSSSTYTLAFLEVVGYNL